jgi:hypothetical protein
MRRVDRLRRELLAACALMEQWTTPMGAIYTRKAIQRWRRMAEPRPPSRRKRPMDTETRAALSEARRRRRGIPSALERDRAVADAQVTRWNELYPVGTPVAVTLDDGTTKLTRTRSMAWVVCGHATVLVEGISGGYSLERMEPHPAWTVTAT